MSCGECGRLIVSGSIITALDKKWHEKCFRCGLCGIELPGSFYGCGGKPFCDGCIDEAEDRHRRGKDSVVVVDEAENRHGGGKDSVAEVVEGDGNVGDRAPQGDRPVSPPPHNDRCMRCGQLIVSGSVVNALEACFHENCFVCFEPGCGQPLVDAFYGCQGLPYCPDHIDIAEDRAAAGIATPTVRKRAPPPPAAGDGGGGGGTTNASAHDDGAAEAPPVLATKPKLPPSSGGDHSSVLWEEAARRAESRCEDLEEKLKHIKMALMEERKTSGHEYMDAQRELEAERGRNQQLQQRIDDLERQVREMSQAGGADMSATVDRCTILEKENLELRNQVNRLEIELRDAQQQQSAGHHHQQDEGFSSAGAPPPPPPGAPPPPPPPAMNVLNPTPLKINRTGQSDKMAAAGQPDASNPQNDLINELKRGRPQLRRTPAQRPSKKDILTRNANVRMAEDPSRPDPSMVKGADTGNSVARNMASNAEKSAGLAKERDQRVKTGEIRMRAHRNKYLDHLLDEIK